jgi:hypothetical protein
MSPSVGDALIATRRLAVALTGQSFDWQGALPALAAGALTAVTILVGLAAVSWRRRPPPPRRPRSTDDALPPGVAEALERRTIRRGRTVLDDSDRDPMVAAEALPEPD